MHGRTKEQNKHRSGSAHWSAVAAVVAAVDVPVIANGGIGSLADAEACLAATGAAAAMSSEALLENPALFIGNRDIASGAYIDQAELARRYLAACAAHPPPSVGHARSHLFKLLHSGLREHVELRDAVLEARSLGDLAEAVERLEVAGWAQPKFHTPEFDPTRSWYWRHRPEGGATPDGGADEVDGEPRSRAEVEAVALAKRERRASERKRRNMQRGAGKGRTQNGAGLQGAAATA